jgi:hypothetical protein
LTDIPLERFLYNLGKDKLSIRNQSNQSIFSSIKFQRPYSAVVILNIIVAVFLGRIFSFEWFLREISHNFRVKTGKKVKINKKKNFSDVLTEKILIFLRQQRMQ